MSTYSATHRAAIAAACAAAISSMFPNAGDSCTRLAAVKVAEWIVLHHESRSEPALLDVVLKTFTLPGAVIAGDWMPSALLSDARTIADAVIDELVAGRATELATGVHLK